MLAFEAAPVRSVLTAFCRVPLGDSKERTVNEDTPAKMRHLIETFENGRLGLAEAADRLAQRDHAEMATTFTQLSAERKDFADQLRELTKGDGDAADTDAAADGTTPDFFTASS